MPIDSEKLAELCLVELVKRVHQFRGTSVQGITYQELARRIGWFNRHGDPHPRLGRVLGVMGHMLEGIESGWDEPIPFIQSLVVNKTHKRGLPDDGIKEFWPDYSKLSDEEKRTRVHNEYQRVAAYGSRWDSVLEKLGLERLAEGNGGTSKETAGKIIKRFGSGLESEAHKALKDKVAKNPHLVNAAPESEAFREYALPSGDEIDVLLKSRGAWVSVEVKSRTSNGNPDDYIRGIYQAVKYGATLEAMRRSGDYPVPDQIISVLVVESKLPEQCEELVRTLKVPVFVLSESL